MNLNQYLSEVESAADLARQLKITPVLVSQWRTGIRDVPGERCIALASATDWQVTPHELRPDLYPHPQDGLPDHMRDAA